MSDAIANVVFYGTQVLVVLWIIALLKRGGER